jgi:hypothetical protein
MDKTAVYLEDSWTQTVDIKCCKHVIIKSTDFASMRITVFISILADGHKAPPTIIHKGAEKSTIQQQSGPILYTLQRKAWLNALFIITWIDLVFALVDTAARKCIA